MSKKLVQKSSCVLDSYYMLEVFKTYHRGIDYNNPYLLIERGEKKKINNFCQVLADSLRNAFEIEVDVFASKKKCPYVFGETISFVKNFEKNNKVFQKILVP